MTSKINDDLIQDIVKARLTSPHSVLGHHYNSSDNSLFIRAFIPYAETITVLMGDKEKTVTKYPMKRVHEEGLFEAVLDGYKGDVKYKFEVEEEGGGSYSVNDPYAFTDSLFSDKDIETFKRGDCFDIYRKLGSHLYTYTNVRGVNFSLWAPGASRVSVVGSFNRWDGRRHQMRLLGDSGIWEIFIPDLVEGDLYKYEIKTEGGDVFLKTDPYAFLIEPCPNTAAIVSNLSDYKWNDSEWISKNNGITGWKLPLSVYDLDLKNCGTAENVKEFTPERFSEITERILPVIKEKNYTHIALSPTGIPIDIHAGIYSINSRNGSPDDFKAFVDSCHLAGIGVIIDWPPSAIKGTARELSFLDGTPLYEKEGHSDRSGFEFNYEQNEVSSFLLSNAAYWRDIFHVDALRTDSLASDLFVNAVNRRGEEFNPIHMLVRDYNPKESLRSEDKKGLIKYGHKNPHSVLGIHYLDKINSMVIRAFIPDTEHMYVIDDIRDHIIYEMTSVDDTGIYESIIPGGYRNLKYRLHAVEKEGAPFTIHDPYSVTDVMLSEFDRHLFAQGNHYRIFEKFGAHKKAYKDIQGVHFSVWAPNAKRVSLVGPFNKWDGRRHQMRLLGAGGIWEIFVPGLCEGDLYKYEIMAQNGDIFLKTDPFAFYTEVPPNTASIVQDVTGKYEWKDSEWIEKRSKTNNWERPVSIYEVHPGSWQKGPDNRFLTYRELADRLIPYVKDMGFTHIELMPIAEHPYDPSWGYQVTNFYAPTSRFGKPEDLMEFIDRCHQNDIGVILDWVTAHFPKDAFALAWFDGTSLYEHSDPRQGEHRDWGTLIFNYGRHEIENFLISNALFWLEKYHFDGLRVDAVASMLYLDYSRSEGDWIPNKYGGRENLDAIEFLKHTNYLVHKEIPGVMMIAEESTSWPGVTKPLEHGGLGFGFKWNMGWMHDTLYYMSKDPVHRKYHHKNLTFGILYAFSENFVLSLSHDEVVHLKGSLLKKMSGDDSQKFANLRILYTFMYTHPGKKLLFMGGEFGQWGEWNHMAGLEWHLLEKAEHKGIQNYIRDLNRLYKSIRCLFEVDFKNNGFEWIDSENADENIIAYLRKGKDPRNCVLIILNFSPLPRDRYRIGVPFPVFYRELLNSDAEEYGGNGNVLPGGGAQAEEVSWHGQPYSLSLLIPPLGSVVLMPMPQETDDFQKTIKKL